MLCLITDYFEKWENIKYILRKKKHFEIIKFYDFFFLENFKKLKKLFYNFIVILSIVNHIVSCFILNISIENKN